MKIKALTSAIVGALGATLICTSGLAAETIKGRLWCTPLFWHTMAISETTLERHGLDAWSYDQKQKGGVWLGKKLECCGDPASNWPLFAEKKVVSF